VNVTVNVRPLAIPDVKLIEPGVFRDERGFFSETFSERNLRTAGLMLRFVQDNHSLSIDAGVVRGLHFQCPPHAQDKLVRVSRGSIFDVAVDLRVGSPTFGGHVSVKLSADNWLQVLVPKGFAHGFCTLEAHTEVLYKVTDYYAPESDRGIRWDDPMLGIQWPIEGTQAMLSSKDRLLPPFSGLPTYFRYEGAESH
jgi:dTDP-4-dehydrorhamnose 3,5-epimerase